MCLMSECTHCFKMWLLRNRTVILHCPQTKACSLFLFIGCFQLVHFKLVFLFSKNSLNWGVFRLLMHSHKSNHFYFCGPSTFVLHFWPRQNSQSTSQLFVQFTSADICSSPVRTGSAHVFTFSIPHFYCSVLYVWSIIYLCIFLITADNLGMVTHL